MDANYAIKPSRPEKRKPKIGYSAAHSISKVP